MTGKLYEFSKSTDNFFGKVGIFVLLGGYIPASVGFCYLWDMNWFGSLFVPALMIAAAATILDLAIPNAPEDKIEAMLSTLMLGCLPLPILRALFAPLDANLIQAGMGTGFMPVTVFVMSFYLSLIFAVPLVFVLERNGMFEPPDAGSGGNGRGYTPDSGPTPHSFDALTPERDDPSLAFDPARFPKPDIVPSPLPTRQKPQKSGGGRRWLYKKFGLAPPDDGQGDNIPK